MQQSHVDITAGQFNEAEKAIIIDEHGSWHNKYFYELDAYIPSIDFKNWWCIKKYAKKKQVEF